MEQQEEREKVLVPVRRREPLREEELPEEPEGPQETEEVQVPRIPRRWRIY